jgi:hypothetical protein
MNGEMTEQYLEQLYDNLSREHMRLMTELKKNDETVNEKDIQKQLTMLNMLMVGSLKLKNLKKKIKTRD